MQPDSERFWSKVEKSSTCWLWTGAKSTAGYGQIRASVRSVYAHRLVFEWFHGPIADGLFVCHRCDVPACCNPAHLFAGTARDNNADMMRKGRHVPKVNGPRGSAISSSRLTEAQVASIKRSLAEGASQPWLGRQYGVSTTTINNISHGKVWRHVEC